jgi:outer membrane protein
MKKLSTILLIFCIVLSLFVLFQNLTNPKRKIGVVQMQTLVFEYKGMKDATKNYSKKMDDWSAQSDSLESKLKFLINEIHLDSINGNKSKYQSDKESFIQLRNYYIDFKEKSNEIATKDDQKMSAGVMNQLNNHIKTYAVKNGFDLVLSNSQNGAVGYANDDIDITKELIEFANKEYDNEN